MELLVVLLIIGILSTVAIRTIDATRDRGLFDKTTKEMNQLVQAIVGNPDLGYDGRRVDFGYYGDMEGLPPGPDLRDLLSNTTGSTAWKGPYVHLTAGGDTTSFLYDAWGNKYDYNPALGTIHSGGNKKYDMTVKIADSLSQLDTNNVIAGTITDRNGAGPGEQTVTPCSLELYYNNPAAHGGNAVAKVATAPGGSYEFSYTSAGGLHVVPIGIHKLVAYTPVETLIRYVTVLPRSKTIVDFKFTSSFWDKLKMVGQPTLSTDHKSFDINVINTQAQDITVHSLNFLPTSAPLYMRDFVIGGNPGTGYPIPNGSRGDGPSDTVNFAPVTIAPNGTQLVDLHFADFHVDSLALTDTSVFVTGNTFEFRFSDGSEITVKP
jgi:hypothetical protein